MDPVNEWDWADWILLVSTALTIVATLGVFGIIVQIIGERRARHREFENMYVQRYWDLIGTLPIRFVQGHADYTPNDSQSIALCNYLLLCEDELDLRAKGFITDQTWEIWRSSIVGIAHDPILRDLIESFPEHRLANLRALVASTENEPEPLMMSQFKRWWSGLT